MSDPVDEVEGVDEVDEVDEPDAADEADDASDDGTAKAVLTYLARMIVDSPDDVEVEEEETRRGVMLRLHVAPDDMGKVIGRRGRVARALRTVVAAAGEQEGINAQVDIVD
jgi:predicted RNA-binding protein YlqC (UPF0109 family)